MSSTSNQGAKKSEDGTDHHTLADEASDVEVIGRKEATEVRI
jgi:hypothetical protein